MKGILKTAVGAFAFSVILAGVSAKVYAGTVVYVGKDVSAEGTTVIGASVENQVGFLAEAETIEKGSLHKGDVIEASNGYSYTVPKDNARMTVWHSVSYGEADCDSAATNEYGVSVSAAITAFANPDAVAADPFVSDGIPEEKIARVVASTAKSAKEAVRTLCSIYEETGASAPEIVFITDPEGVWIVENYTGHQYAATKLPDDVMATFSNEFIIRTIDPEDKNTVCSKDLFDIAEKNGFAVYDKNRQIDIGRSYRGDDITEGELGIRVRVGHDIFAPSDEIRYDADMDMDVFFAPDDKVSIKDVFDLFRNRYEGTPFDLADPDNHGTFLGINNQTVSGVQLFQIFDDVDDALSTVAWVTPANPTAAPFIPIPALADSLPEIYTTDINEDGNVDGMVQYDFVKLNNNVYPARDRYGDSIHEYWRGIENMTVDDVCDRIRGQWKDSYDSVPAKAVCEANDFVNKIITSAGDDAVRLLDELEWYQFKNGVRKYDLPEDVIAPFECSFDAVSYATANGWSTSIDGDVFIAEKDGRTIEVTFAGDDKGNITFSGFDEEELEEDFLSDATGDIEVNVYEYDFVAEDTEDTEEAAEEATEEKESEVKPEEKTEEKTEDKKEEKTEEKSEDKSEDNKTPDAETVEKIENAAAEQIEVDTIAALGEYFDERIASIPRDGWTEKEVKKQFDLISKDVSKIISKYFNIKIENFFDLITLDEQIDPKGFIKSRELADMKKRLSETGDAISGLIGNYFAASYEDVAADLASGRLSQEGAEKILREAQSEIEGIIRLYINGMFGDVFNLDLSAEEVSKAFSDIGEGTLQVIEDYSGIDPRELEVGGVSIGDLTDADIDVVVTLSEMDDDVINGLSDLLGVDVRGMLDEYVREIKSVIPGGKITFKEENHQMESAETAPDPETEAVIELQEALSEDDAEVPQEVIDILTEAIEEANSEEAADDPADAATADTAEDTADTVTAPDTSFTVNVGNVEKNGEKIMLPAFMLKYFN